MNRIIKLVFCLVFIFCTNARAKTEVMFTPSLQCENKIEDWIDKSKKTVDIAVYSLNNDKLIEAIERAYNQQQTSCSKIPRQI